MANHVNTYVHFESINAAAAAKLEELYSRIRNEGNNKWFSDMWGIDPVISDEYQWNIDNVGSKWCYVDDVGEDFIHLVSAWSYPEEGIIWLVQELAKVDPNVIAYVTYEDEMPNFFGCWMLDKDGVIDGQDWDEEEIDNLMKQAVPELANINEEEDSERYWEVWGDNIWNVVGDAQDEIYRSMREWLVAEGQLT